MDKITIGQNIKDARKQSGMTQQQLAEKIGKTESSIRKYEKGLVDTPLNVLKEIAEVLNWPLADLLDFSSLYSIPEEESAAYDFSTEEQKLFIDVINKMKLLNEEGKQEVIKRIDELSRLDEYKKGDE